MKKAFIFLSLLIILTPAITSATMELNLQYPIIGGVDLNGLDCAAGKNCISTLIVYAYDVIVGISGLAAFAMIIWGGVEWMTSSGDTGKTTEAKDRIKKALYGLVIILSSYLVLSFINSDLVNIKEPTPQQSQ